MKKAFFSIFALLALFSYSCTKSLENKLRGTWVVENTNWPNYPKIGNDSSWWHFEGGILTIRYAKTSNIDSCTYTFKRKGASRYLVISTENDSKALLGKGTKDWFIVRLKKDQLRLAYGVVDKEGRQRGLEQYDLKRIGD